MADGWLPAFVEFDGDWNKFDEYVERVYAVFARDFNDTATRPTFQGRRLGLKLPPTFQGKSATFWHFVTEGKDEEKRTPDRARCERIAWPKAMIAAAATMDGRVFSWLNRRPNGDRWLISLPDFSYIVVLADRGEYLLPWTAFCVEHDHRRRKLRAERDTWQRAQKAEAALRQKRGPFTPPTPGG
jgi:hypothetical protein